MEDVEEVVRYSYRIRPGAKAQASLLAEWGRCRWLWNEAVHMQSEGRRPAYRVLAAMLTDARGKFAWLRAGSVVPQQAVLRSYALALRQSTQVARRCPPTMKRQKIALPSLEYTTRGFTLKDGILNLPRGVSIPVVWSRDLPSEATSVRIHLDSIGHWYAVFVVRREITPSPATDGAIGIDWGVTTTATATDPDYDLPFAGHRECCAAELAKAQRQMARRRRSGTQPPSNGYRRERQKAARLHKKAHRQNTHAACVWSQRVVAGHQLIAVEDFKPKFLTRSTLARKAADAAIATAKRVLVERGLRAGREVVMVPPPYTTMTCSKCATRTKSRLELSQRTFRCDACGHTADRDRNAAWTILATAERNRAGADDVGHLRVQSEPESPLVGRR